MKKLCGKKDLLTLSISLFIILGPVVPCNPHYLWFSIWVKKIKILTLSRTRSSQKDSVWTTVGMTYNQQESILWKVGTVIVSHGFTFKPTIHMGHVDSYQLFYFTVPRSIEITIIKMLTVVKFLTKYFDHMYVLLLLFSYMSHISILSLCGIGHLFMFAYQIFHICMDAIQA